MILLCEALAVPWSVLLFFCYIAILFFVGRTSFAFCVLSISFYASVCIHYIIGISSVYSIARIHIGFYQNRNRSNGCFLRARRQPRHGTTEPRCQNPMAHGNATHPLATRTLPRIRRHPCRLRRPLPDGPKFPSLYGRWSLQHFQNRIHPRRQGSTGSKRRHIPIQKESPSYSYCDRCRLAGIGRSRRHGGDIVRRRQEHGRPRTSGRKGGEVAQQ
mmetsp:Transcript_17014/g.27477  ORF Transcript_17014/g.27477 Transcript_17014/m.27477 type:complete len:216 (-) Transcript_17014:738-1385(-)